MALHYQHQNHQDLQKKIMIKQQKKLDVRPKHDQRIIVIE